MEVRSDDVQGRRMIQKARLLPSGEGYAEDPEKNQKAADDFIEKQRLFQEYYSSKNGHEGAQVVEDAHGGSLQLCEGEVCQHGGKERGGNPKKENGKKVAIGAKSHLVGVHRGSQPHSDKQSTIEKDETGKDGHDRDLQISKASCIFSHKNEICSRGKAREEKKGISQNTGGFETDALMKGNIEDP